MKIELTEEQIARLKSVGNANPYNAVQAVIKLYESEMRPKDAAPVMWRRKGRGPFNAVLWRSAEAGFSTRDSLHATHYISWDDLRDLPIEADPTPEEKAEADMESAWKSTPVGNGGHKDCFRAGFMAAKFPAEGGVKP